MNDVSFVSNGFEVDAGIVGRAFGMTPTSVMSKMRSGEITSRCETGIDADAGRWRMTFYFGGRALRLVVDQHGAILSRATFPSHAPQARPVVPGSPRSTT